MLHNTKCIVLRVTKYGDTSIIMTAYTELFGLQQYMVKGVRVTSKKGGLSGSPLNSCDIQSPINSNALDIGEKNRICPYPTDINNFSINFMVRLIL